MQIDCFWCIIKLVISGFKMHLFLVQCNIR